MLFDKRNDKDTNSKKKWWNEPKRQKWILIGIIVLVVVIGVAAITYFTYDGEEFQDISWNELTK